MSDAPPESERPNLRTGENGELIIDLKDNLSAVEEMKRLDKIMSIVEESETLQKAQKKVDEEFSDG